MSKSSKRRLAIAAIKNAADNQVAASCTPAQLTQAAGTASALATQDPALPSLGLLVPSGLSGLSDSSLNSQLSTLNLPSDLVSNSAPFAPPLNSEISNFKSPSDSESASSLPLNSQLSTLNLPSSSSAPSSPSTPLLSAARTSLIASLAPDPALAAITPDQIFIDLPPLPPDPPSAFTGLTTGRTTQDSPVPPVTPVQDEFADFQAKMRAAMREWSPADPRIKTMLENYATIMQTVTLERLTTTLPTLSEEAWVKTNAQIIRLHAIMERTNSRHIRQQRDEAAQARREARELQRKERQAQKEQEAIARNQRNKDREEQRRQREQAKADRDEQKYQLALRKLELKERNVKLDEGEKTLDEKHEHHQTCEAPSRTIQGNQLGS